jgi:hypothetical protein
MTYLFGLLIAFVCFGGIELISRSIGLPLSIFGALGAVLRQTDVPGLQRRQALTLLLLAVGGGMTIVGGVMLVNGLITRMVFSSMAGGVFLLTIAGHIGSRTLRAIGRAAVSSKNQTPDRNGPAI